mmetsp:Transcript_7442/g.19363  ORF Transcript_7442/g.19363 Transcript_7442/m.19363 type:complete len:153 (+) Transcript_7442:29-487(+)
MAAATTMIDRPAGLMRRSSSNNSKLIAMADLEAGTSSVICPAVPQRRPWRLYAVVAVTTLAVSYVTRCLPARPVAVEAVEPATSSDAPSHFEKLLTSNFGPDNGTSHPRRSKSRKKRDEKKARFAKKRATSSNHSRRRLDADDVIFVVRDEE